MCVAVPSGAHEADRVRDIAVRMVQFCGAAMGYPLRLPEPTKGARLLTIPSSHSTDRRLRLRALPALLLGALAAAIGAGLAITHAPAEEARVIPPPAVDSIAPPEIKAEVAVLAGGCFWGVQGVFQHVAGVSVAVSGYAGGDIKTARYDLVSTGQTAHAEAVRVTFDPHKISYGQILQVFFSVVHDPTQLNRQGPDIGPQYRSAIVPTTPEQARIAKAYIDQLDAARVYAKAIATRIEMDNEFFRAETYHQDFMTRHPTHGYIVAHDRPKVENLKRVFPNLYRAEPALVSATRVN
jgi:peptide-methionine (S)-S-oxide reductase